MGEEREGVGGREWEEESERKRVRGREWEEGSGRKGVGGRKLLIEKEGEADRERENRTG